MFRRYFVAFIGLILLIIFVVFLFSIGSNAPAPVKEQQKPVHEYANSETIAILTLQGRVVGDDKYQSIRITVGRDFRRIELLDGYNLVVEKSKDFSNNQTAYDTFLRALQLNGFTKTRKAVTSDERGVCSNGNRYVYELKDGDKQLQRTWSTSCSTGQGTYAGGPSIKQLFQSQITDYNIFTTGISIQ